MDRRQAKESSIFQAVVVWCKHDEEARKTDFSNLFDMVKLQEISQDYLENVILKERLVTNTNDRKEAVLRAIT